MRANDTPTRHDGDKNQAQVQINISVASRLRPLFYQFLGQGFRIYTQTGCSIKELLCTHLGIAPDYLEGRIQTIFLNSQPVDRIEDAIVEDKVSLALSGPMPGLAGATMRRGGFYASMRRQISYDQNPLSTATGTGEITIKLFNIVAKELGPHFLQNGIWIAGENFQDFIRRYPHELKAGCRSIELDGNHLEAADLPSVDWSNKAVFLRVTSEQIE